MNQSAHEDRVTFQSGPINYCRPSLAHAHELRSSSNEEVNSDGEVRYSTMMQQSLDALSQNLVRLNNELAGNPLKRRKTAAPGGISGFKGERRPSTDDPFQRKRKIPQSFQLFPKSNDQDSPQHWTSILRNQILDESTNDSFKERRKELLVLLATTVDENKVIISQKLKKNHQNLNTDGFRGSTYRGVSKNKNKWQMMIMGNFKKMYIGAIEDEQEAASLYDKIAILVHGLKVRFKWYH